MGGAAGQDMGLTEREQEVLHLIAEGYTDAEIGARCIFPSTPRRTTSRASCAS